VFPGSTPAQVAAVIKELTVVVNDEQRQVVARSSAGESFISQANPTQYYLVHDHAVGCLITALRIYRLCL
jgi:hypothetical protein